MLPFGVTDVGVGLGEQSCHQRTLISCRRKLRYTLENRFHPAFIPPRLRRYFELWDGAAAVDFRWHAPSSRRQADPDVRRYRGDLGTDLPGRAAAAARDGRRQRQRQVEPAAGDLGRALTGRRIVDAGTAN